MGYLGHDFGKRRLLSLAIIALVAGASLGGVMWSLGEVYDLNQPVLNEFSSYEELVSFIRKGPEDAPQSLLQRLLSLFGGGWSSLQYTRSPAFKGLLDVAPEGFSDNAPEHSTTNIQVEGVDEADLVKTDGEHIYLVSDSTVYILRAYPPESGGVLSSIDLKTSVPGIFVSGDKLVVFTGGLDGGVYRLFEDHPVEVETSILVYDISERGDPVLERNVTISGFYFASRMIGDHVYAVLNQPAQLINESDVNLPEICSDNITTRVEASNIHHGEFPDAYDFYTNIVAVNITEVEGEPTIETYLLGATSSLYVSRENIYLTSSPYPRSRTEVHRISIDGGAISHEAEGSVPGYVLNQFSMDEHDRLFRIATTTGSVWSGDEETSESHVYVLDMELSVTGRLEGLAPREQIYSARFMGDRCYLVTFRKIDPLFVINLSKPESPQVLGKLKIPGYSDYLHPYDEDHLIGVGKETVASEVGEFSWYQGVKISLFDVSNVSKPKEVAKYEVGDRGTDSLALREHKAFLFSKSRNLLVLPILLAEVDEEKYPDGVPPNTHGDYVYQGAYVFNVSREGGIDLRGRVTHLPNNEDLVNSGYYYSSPYSVKRTLYIGQVLYTISDRGVRMNDLKHLEERGFLELNP